MNYLLHFAKIIAKFIYEIFKLFPTQNKVVLISRFNKQTSLDFSLLKDEINKKKPETKVVVLNHKLRNKLFLIFDVLLEMYHLATSKGAIIDSYIIPVSILRHKKDLIIIQIWHSLGAVKKFGRACLDTKEGAKGKMADIMNIHENYTYIIAGGEKTIPFYREAFGTKKTRIVPYSLPRVDYMVNKDNMLAVKYNLYTKYPGLKEKKNIFYFPTFRKNQIIPYDKLIDAVDFEKYNLIIKKHKHDKNKIPNDPRIYSLKDEEVIDILSVTDYLISDYSGTLFEASVLTIPLFIYTFDLDLYEVYRGLFINLEKDAPGFVSRDAKEIIKAIETENYDLNKVKKFREDYVSVVDGTSSEKIIHLLDLKRG